ncbi:MAG: hypothetical protein FWG65_10770 [Turicibacter sp.]|nr:hypothetical protein [Turicibacter sp.]
MFKFDDNYTILEHDVMEYEMQQKYPNKYMIVTNCYRKDYHDYGDIIAILTSQEYYLLGLELSEPMMPKYHVWKGLALVVNNMLGFLPD